MLPAVPRDRRATRIVRPVLPEPGEGRPWNHSEGAILPAFFPRSIDRGAGRDSTAHKKLRTAFTSLPVVFEGCGWSPRAWGGCRRTRRCGGGDSKPPVVFRAGTRIDPATVVGRGNGSPLHPSNGWRQVRRARSGPGETADCIAPRMTVRAGSDSPLHRNTSRRSSSTSRESSTREGEWFVRLGGCRGGMDGRGDPGRFGACRRADLGRRRGPIGSADSRSQTWLW